MINYFNDWWKILWDDLMRFEQKKQIDEFYDVLSMIYIFVQRKPYKWLWQEIHWIERLIHKIQGRWVWKDEKIWWI